jgi:hypothetical protein
MKQFPVKKAGKAHRFLKTRSVRKQNKNLDLQTSSQGKSRSSTKYSHVRLQRSEALGVQLALVLLQVFLDQLHQLQIAIDLHNKIGSAK